MKKNEKYILIDYDRKFIDIKGIKDYEFLNSIYLILTEFIEFDKVDVLDYEDFIKHLESDLKRYKKYKRNQYEFRSNSNKK